MVSHPKTDISTKKIAKEKFIKVGKGNNIDIQLDWLNQTNSQLVRHRETTAILAVNEFVSAYQQIIIPS